MCVLNHTSGERDVRAVLEHLASAEPSLASLSPDRRPHGPERLHVPTTGSAPVESPAILEVPLLAGLSADGQRTVLRTGHEIQVAAGVSVVRRWAADRDFYVVLEGQLVVDVDGVMLRRLGEHDFFGELAARDWGSGFAYPRSATVTAERESRLWVLPPESFNRLMAGEPSMREVVERAATERLSRN
jgi:CRP-like cAMP-binding protein